MFTARKASTAFPAVREKVLMRDNHSCQFCGFQAQDYQEVINLDQDYNNNKLSNMVTACCFCAQCLFIESVGNDTYGGGSLIYCPELSQVDVNSLCHVLFCAITNNAGYRELGQSVYRSLKLRSQPVENKFGEGMSDPVAFGQALFETDVTSTEKVTTIFKDLRLLPSRARFKTQIDRWAKAAAAEPPKQ